MADEAKAPRNSEPKPPESSADRFAGMDVHTPKMSDGFWRMVEESKKRLAGIRSRSSNGED